MTGASTTVLADRGPPPGRLPLLERYGKFVVVGLTGFVINLVVFAVTLDALSPSPTFDLVRSVLAAASHSSVSLADDLVASAVAFAVATLWNFGWNSVWTFRSRSGHRHSLPRRLGLYYGVSLGSLAINEVALIGLSFVLPPLYGQAIGILAGSVVGFAGNSRITFVAADLER